MSKQVLLPSSASRALGLIVVALLLAACEREATPSLEAPAALVASRSALLQLPDFTTLVEKQGVAVVNVSTTQTGPFAAASIPGVPEDHPLQDFFRRTPPAEREDPSNSLGSGFILSEDGYILTNAHVLDDADEVTVRLTDKREFTARVIGADARTDVALLKIDAEHLPTVRIGDPSALKVGEWVVAIGSPFGFENSVTAGIVSAVGRALPDESLVPFIQTDVAINPGNSGGPLFDLNGAVVGINSQIYSRTGGYMGLSFAIPIDLAIKISEELRAKGKVTRGWLGVQIQDVTPELAGSFNLDAPAGALVAEVEDGSPAANAGIRSGDVITAFGGKAIGSSGELPPMVAATVPGTEVPLQFWRRGKSRELAVVIEQMTEERPAERPREQTVPPNRLGLVLSELDEAERRELNVSSGLFVESAVGAAAKAGIREGDVVMAVNDEPVSSLSTFNKLLAQQPPDHAVALLVQRGGRALYIAVRPDAAPGT
ncbi:MAG: DegQ family serine endoprotease [Betaproteobacteria bacterium]|nr:DegQ family serine endoprotease [Betaproteobacteria bacterium]